jgi:hypothetical protein
MHVPASLQSLPYTHTPYTHTTTVPLSRAWKQCTVQKAQFLLAVPVPVLSVSTVQEVDPLVLTVLLTVQ